MNKKSGTVYPLVQRKSGGLLLVPLPKNSQAATAFLAHNISNVDPVVGVANTKQPNLGVASAFKSVGSNIGINEDPEFYHWTLDDVPADRCAPCCAFACDCGLQTSSALDVCCCEQKGAELFKALSRASDLMEVLPDSTALISSVLTKLSKPEQHLLVHARMSHLSNDGLKELLDAGTEGICFHPSVKSLCGPCMEANQRLQPIPRRAPATTRNPDAEFGTDLHIDTVYATTPDIDGNRYQITVGDEKTTSPFIALSKTRGTIITKAAIKICENIKSRSGRKINSITIDRGTELFNHVLSDYCIKETGKPLRVSLTEKPWQNGLAERIQQTLWSMARADLKHADLSYSFWGPAVLNAATVILYRPVKRLGGKSFIHYVTKKPGNVTRFRVFGCPVSVFIRPR